MPRPHPPLRLALTLALTLGWVGVAPTRAQETQTSQNQTNQSQTSQPQDTAAPPANAAPATPALTSPAPADPTTPPPQAIPGPTEHEVAGGCVEGSENACLELLREGDDGKSRKIIVIRTGVTDDTGVYIICGRQDNEPEDTPTQLVFSETGAGGIRVLIDKNVISVPLAVVTQQPGQEGEEQGDGRVEASAGTATFLEEIPEGASDRLTRCGVDTKPKAEPGTVLVTQGKTELKGQKLVYDESDGIARIDGPITFKRQDEKQPLTGSSERIEVNVDDEKTILLGNVVLNSEGGRVSRAGRVEYDDTRNIARLIGTPEQPAVSTKGKDTLSAGMMLYYLDKDEVRTVKPEGGTITGEFEDSEPTSP